MNTAQNPQCNTPAQPTQHTPPTEASLEKPGPISPPGLAKPVNRAERQESAPGTMPTCEAEPLPAAALASPAALLPGALAQAPTSDPPAASTQTTARGGSNTTAAPEPGTEPPNLAMSPVFGALDSLSESERAEFFACEEVVGSGWHTFVQVGLALARIKEAELYREEYDTFEAYCRQKWQYGRIYVYHLISAAQLFNYLVANCKHRKPDHESQLRPLLGLTRDQAQEAWERAAEKAGTRSVTARLVRSAMQELQLAGPTEPKPARRNTARQRQIIDDAIGQLLVLASHKANHELLISRLEALHGYFRSLFATPSRRQANTPAEVQ